MKKELVIGLASGFVVGIGVGGGAVYAFLNKKYGQALNEAIDNVSEEIRRDYAKFYKDWQPKPSLEEALSTIEENEVSAAQRLVTQAKAEREEILNDEFYNGKSEDVEEPVVTETRNIFDDEREEKIKYLSTPDPAKPYLITAEEYEDPYENYGKLSLTWFEEDDIIIEEGSENIIDNTELIGSEVLEAFGHDPRDKDMIHVRNVNYEADLEVTRDRRSYAEVIAGVAPYDDEEPRKKPRREDDDR